MAKAPQKSKEAKAKAATGSSKKSKKKWSKGKSRDKLQNLCLFDKPTYDRLMKEVPKYKVWNQWRLSETPTFGDVTVKLSDRNQTLHFYLADL